MSICKCFFALALTLSVVPVLAHGPEAPASLDSKIRDADFVFAGRVVKVEYAISTPKGVDVEAVPHTFVTYAIDRIFKGKSASKLVTLRFLGGRGTGARFLYPGNYPLFDVGDVDLLTVQRNGMRSCPLAECAEGRYRMISGKVYSELGKEVVLDPKGRVVDGLHRDLPEVTTHVVSKTTITRKSVLEPGEDPVPVPKIPGTHFDSAAFMQHVQTRVSKLYTPDQLKRFPAVVSVDPTKPFIKKLAPVRAGPIVAPPRRGPEPESLDEQNERIAFERGNGNPVIK